MNHETLQELLALYVLGILAPEEIAVVEAHLAAGCAPCTAEHATLTATATELAWSVTPVTPPQRVRDAVLRAAHAATEPEEAPLQIWKSWATSAVSDLDVVRADDGLWETVLAGVTVKRLSFDKARGSATMLVRMAPGTSYPGHRHASTEECYVLEGDLHIGDTIVMHAGDFQRASGGSVHATQSTRDGCLLLITSSLEDELLA